MNQGRQLMSTSGVLMLLKANSITKELIAYSAITVAILLSIVAFFVVGHVADLNREQVESSLAAQLESNSSKIESFFVERGRIVDSVFSSPFILDWFENYTERGSDITEDKTYQQFTQYFKQFTIDDPSVKAVFFAPAKTHEYFDPKGRYGDPSYYTNKRPWWQEALDKGRFFASIPSIDYVDGSVVSAVKKPIKDSNGDFLGFGGVDILISTVNEHLLSKMSYKGQGQTFLIANDGSIIFFPKIEKIIKEQSEKYAERSPKLSEVDSLYDGAAGFTKLEPLMTAETSGMATVEWKDEKHIVAFHPVQTENPSLDWSLAMMVPSSVVEDPIQHTIWTSISVVVVIILLVSLSSGIVTRKIIAPLGSLVSTMREIATGEGDLTKRIEIDRKDELGQLGEQFNVFIEKIQDLIKQSKSAVSDVDDSAGQVVEAINKASVGARSQKEELELIATASTEMSHTVQEISQGTKRTTEYASFADNQASKGQGIVAESTASIEALSAAVNQAADVVDQLNQDSESIGQVLEVIRAIAEQTNLLALNAAIEAARAGEQGRGFAVVADEVRSLAQRTQESTENIQNIIGGLQSNAHNAVNAMQDGQSKASEGVQSAHAVRNILSEIANCIAQIQSQAEEINTATTEQVKVSEEITRNVVNIRDLADGTVNQAELVAETAHRQQETSRELASIINKFKV